MPEFYRKKKLCTESQKLSRTETTNDEGTLLSSFMEFECLNFKFNICALLIYGLSFFITSVLFMLYCFWFLGGLYLLVLHFEIQKYLSVITLIFRNQSPHRHRIIFIVF